MGRITINGTMSQFSYKLTVRSTLWDAKAKKASGRSLEAQRLNEKLENIKTLQASSNVWAKTAPIPPMRITACGAGVLQLCTNTNTMSRTFRSKS